MQMGVMLGPVLPYLVTFSYLMPFLVQSLITLFAAIMVFIFLPRSPVTPAAKMAQTQAAQAPASSKLRFLDGRYSIFLMQALAVYICMGMVQQTLGFYFQNALHIDGAEAAKLYSFAMIVSSAAMLLAQLVLVQRVKLAPQQFILLGLPFFVIGFMILALAQNGWMLYIGMAFFGFGMGCCGPSFSAAASLAVEPHEQGALAGLIGSVAGMGFVIGPILGGFLYAMNGSFPYLAATALAAAVLLWVISKRFSR